MAKLVRDPSPRRGVDDEGLREERYTLLKEALVVCSQRVFDALNRSTVETAALVELIDVLNEIVSDGDEGRATEIQTMHRELLSSLGRLVIDP